MNVEAEAENVACGDCHTQQSVATSLCSEQLQHQLRVLKIQRGEFDDENNDNTLSSTAVKDSFTNGNAECNETGDCLPPRTASDKGTEIQHIMCYMNCDNSSTSAEANAADLMSSDATNAETQHCFLKCDAPDDGEHTDCLPTENMQPARETDSNESVSVADCDNDSRLLTSECTEAAPDMSQLVDINSENEHGQCFSVSSEFQTQCTSVSLQDAFMHFLKKKQVS